MSWLAINDDAVLEHAGKYYSRRQWAEFGVEVLDKAGGGTLLSSVVASKSTPGPDYSPVPLNGGRVVIEDSPWSGGYVEEFMKRVACRACWTQRIEEVIRRHEVVIHRVPSPFLPYVAAACQRLRKALMIVVSGPLVEAAVLLHELPRFLVPLARAYLRWKDAEQIRLGRQAKVVFLHGGPDLLSQWRRSRRVLPWRTGHLTRDMFHHRDDTCQGDALRLIRVCHVSGPRGIETLLRALALMRKSHPKAILDIVGDGHRGFVARMKRLADELHIADQICWHGWCNRVRTHDLLRQADIHVVSSDADAIPRVILEGAANGLPLVTTSAGGIPMWVKDEKNGLLVPPRSPEALAAAIQRLVGDRSLRRTLIRHGYDDAREWTIEQTTTRMVRIIQESS